MHLVINLVVNGCLMNIQVYQDGMGWVVNDWGVPGTIKGEYYESLDAIITMAKET